VLTPQKPRDWDVSYRWLLPARSSSRWQAPCSI